jgi:threonine/homoserine/homoserine lactone efflux protein
MPMPPIPAVLPAALTFALVMSITPGPNNTMLLSSGASFGFRRTLPHMVGISCGFTAMMLAIALGAGQLFERLPWLYRALEIGSIAYLLYLAWKIATAGTLSVRHADQRPMTWIEAAAFQGLNPKAWMMAVTGATTFRLHHDVGINAVLLAVVFGVMNFPAIGVWAAFGTSMRRFLSNPRALTVFNWVMAALLVASTLPALAPAFAHSLGSARP